MENGTPYTLALWRVKEGKEEELVQAWKGELAEYFLGLPNPPGAPGTLIRSVEDPQLFTPLVLGRALRTSRRCVRTPAPHR